MSILFIKSKDIVSPKQHVLGGTVEIQAVLKDSLESGDTVTIQIQDAYERKKVEDVAMTEVTPGVYSYSWQSTEGGVTDEPGIYRAFISVTSGGNVYIDKTEFEMIDIMET